MPSALLDRRAYRRIAGWPLAVRLVALVALVISPMAALSMLAFQSVDAERELLSLIVVAEGIETDDQLAS